MIDAKIGEVIKVPTEPRKPKKQIDLKTVSSANDLKSLQKQDPFLYYSIPGVRRASLLGRDVDTSDLVTSGMARNCISCPARLEQDKAQQTQTVTRRSCISFECHPDLLLEDMLDDTDDDFAVEDGDEDLLDFFMDISANRQ